MKLTSNSQGGFTLVELMISMVITLVAIMSMLSLFQGISRNSGEAKIGAHLDGQIQNGLLAAHKLLQGAGYGSSGGYGTDLQLITGASLDKDTGNFSGVLLAKASLGNVAPGIAWALLWVNNGSLAGLYAPTQGGLYTLSSGGSVTPLNGSNNSWLQGAALISPPPAAAPNLASSGRVGITMSESSCQPPGLPPGGVNDGAFTVTLNVSGNVAGGMFSSLTCLFNY